MDDDAVDPVPTAPPESPEPPEAPDTAAAPGEHKLHVVAVVGLVAAAVPFVLSFSTTSSRTVNGVVVASSSFNPIAVAGGAAAIVAALVLIVLLLRKRVGGPLNNGAAIAVLGLGLYHLLGGLGTHASTASAGIEARPVIGARAGTGRCTRRATDPGTYPAFAYGVSRARTDATVALTTAVANAGSRRSGVSSPSKQW